MTESKEAAIDIELPAGQGPAVSTIGTDHLFASLHVRRLGEIIELVNELTIYSSRTGRYDTEELGRKITDDEDDAVNIAIDMQRAARRRLNELDVSDFDITITDEGFGEALEAHFDKTRAHYAIAAE
jgi:hypothetical protein